MAEQPAKNPETIETGSALNWNDFQKLQEAEMAKLEKIVGPLKNGGPKLDDGTSANLKQAFAPLSIKKCCPFNSVDWDMTGQLTGTASARAKRTTLYYYATLTRDPTGEWGSNMQMLMPPHKWRASLLVWVRWQLRCDQTFSKQDPSIKDIASLYSQPLPGIFFVPKEDDFTCVHSMIIGNFDTPYEGGFFFFYVRFGPQYPFEPPRVCAMSCYRFGNKVRFNPNMYEDGTVCLSILGTWRGPAWTAANNLAGVLLSIQSLFCDQALCNEPGYTNRRDTGDESVAMYDVYVRHETLRVAVIHTIECAEEYKVPPELVQVMKCSFMEYYDSYIASCDSLAKYDGQKFQITLRSFHIFSPDFSKLKEKLIKLHATLLEEEEAEGCPPSGKNKFIKENAPAARSSSESSLSEFSDDSSPASCSCPSKDQSSPASISGSPSVPSQPNASEAQIHEASTASTSAASVGSLSISETSQKNPFRLKKISGLTSAVQSILSNPSQGASKKLVSPKMPNTKVANVVKIDSAPCEKILKELANLDEAVPSTSSWVNMEQCLDFLSFMAESESEYEELSDSDQPFDNENNAEESDVNARISDGKSGVQQMLVVDSTANNPDTLRSLVDGDAGADSLSLCDGHIQSESSLPLELSTVSDDVRSAGYSKDEVVSEETSCSIKNEKTLDRVCAEGELSDDSAGRGLKRKNSAAINMGLIGREKKSPTPPPQ